jgi:hypothetical protein
MTPARPTPAEQDDQLSSTRPAPLDVLGGVGGLVFCCVFPLGALFWAQAMTHDVFPAMIALLVGVVADIAWLVVHATFLTPIGPPRPERRHTMRLKPSRRHRSSTYDSGRADARRAVHHPSAG